MFARVRLQKRVLPLGYSWNSMEPVWLLRRSDVWAISQRICVDEQSACGGHMSHYLVTLQSCGISFYAKLMCLPVF